MSRIADVDKSGFERLSTVTGFATRKSVAAGLLMADQTNIQYPAALWSIVAVKKSDGFPSDETEGVADTQIFAYTIEAGVLILANSSGQELGDARMSAWYLVDAVMDAYADFVPTVAADVAAYPCVPGDPQNVLTDSQKAGIYIPLLFKITWG
jgi:hypothetical protein